MLGDLPWYARHVGRLPGKSVLVGAEEVDEREFLFGGQLGPDTDRLSRVIVVDRNWLGFLGRDESRSKGMTCRAFHFTGQRLCRDVHDRI